MSTPVRHPKAEGEVWLVVSRPAEKRKPWHLLANEPVDNPWRRLAGGDGLRELLVD